ncbi:MULTISPECIES: hypothetical protein [Photorhabdus]|uniref:hypothetical protein n=1 Tax=Photorhabdus TaxID=29487 RepID=UPI0018641261|nr:MULTISPECIES: hypothetical protein [Photorhabdus]MCW7547131.1 hypothetical protein [Photorhabdus aballayi]
MYEVEIIYLSINSQATTLWVEADNDDEAKCEVELLKGIFDEVNVEFRLTGVKK